MMHDYEKCTLEYRSVSFQSEIARSRFKEALEDYKMEIDRFKAGMDQIEWKDYVKKAFIYMIPHLTHRPKRTQI
jgi:hypothetical protein